MELLEAGILKDSLYGKTFQGGLIFYLDDHDSIPGVKGYVSLPYDQSMGIEWGCYLELVPGADGTVIGTGYQNTIDIGSANNLQCAGDIKAVDVCFGNINGFDDWFLPSRDQLTAMYLKIGPGATGANTNIGGFEGLIYWSSSEINVEDSWVVFFNSGIQNNFSKDNYARVRPIRAF